MENENTLVFDVDSINSKIISNTLKEVCGNLNERGYNSINQLVGYILSGDLGYISSYKNSRNKIADIDRSTLVEALLRSYLSWDI